MPDPHIITLRRPVGPKGREISELSLREPRAGEVLKASRETGRGLALSLLTQVAGADIEAIQALPGRVCDRALDYLMTFVAPILAEPTEDAAPAEQPDELTIPLAETLQIGTTWVSELNLREPTLGELIKGDKYEGMQRTVVLVALASGLPRAVIELVPISEFAKAASFVLGFTEAAPKSGGGSSGT
jgi:Phage tail assembly chaperone proteins, E, or 41 or 14